MKLKKKMLEIGLKALRKPLLHGTPKTGKWYRIQLPNCQTEGRMEVNTCFRVGTENKLIVFLHGGGVSWNEYMAARPSSFYIEEDAKKQQFYCIDSYLVSDLVTNMGFMNSDVENPFHAWSAISIPYSTGDFHCGMGDFPYTGIDGKQKVLHHHGLINVKVSIEAAMKYIPENPETVMIAGFSAGGFGTAIISDEIIKRFPNAKEYISYNDSGFMLYPDWRKTAEKVWHAPKAICDRIVSNNISLDCMKALHRDYGDRVKILFSCSVRDSALSEYWRYVQRGELGAGREEGENFQRDLKNMVEELQKEIPNAAIFLFDTLEKMKEKGDVGLTTHCIGASQAAKTVVVDGKSCMNWIADAAKGSGEKLGLSLLNKK